MFKNSKVALIALSVVTFLLLAFVALDLYNIRNKNEETSRLLNLAQQVAEEEALIQSIRTIQNSAKEDLTSFEEVGLTDDKIVPLIESIERAAKSLGLIMEIASVEKTEEAKADEPQMLDIVIETEGSWGSTFSFLKSIESLPQRVMIREARFSKGESRWTSVVSLSLYLFN